MKFVRFSTDPATPPTTGDGAPGVHWGVTENNEITIIDGTPYGEYRVIGPSMAWQDVRLLPPCCPTKIVCVGRNYANHAKELGNEIPSSPLIFFKPPSSLAAHKDSILYPPDSSRVDYEGEIAVVIGRRLRNLAAGETAAPYILGFTCLNDVTARDLQKGDGQWTRGKGFDTFCPVGPLLATGLDSRELEVRAYLNGELQQKGHVRDMIFDFDVLLRYISRVMTLEPGDIIATGTPEGVGPMKVGDEVAIEIDGVGRLRNSLVAATL